MKFAIPVLATALLVGCASNPLKSAAPVSTTGTVQSIREIREPGRIGNLFGTIGGAAIGGVAGAQIGSGTTQIVAGSVLSVITGGIGQSIGRRFGTRTHYEVLVRHEDGIDRLYAMDTPDGVKPGATVNVDAKGKLTPSP